MIWNIINIVLLLLNWNWAPLSFRNDIENILNIVELNELFVVCQITGKDVKNKNRDMTNNTFLVKTCSTCFLVLCFPPQGSLDNISIIIICFPGAPQLSQEALQQEAALERQIDIKVEGDSTLITTTMKWDPKTD